MFLDEIGELPLSMQAKLLTFLEDRRFKRVGGLRDIEVNVRIIAATNRDLEEEVEKGTFREDLFYRLNVMQIRIPPLRERKEDIPVLARFYLEHFNRKFNKHLKDIDPAFLREMESYYWKGNVRELRNFCERLVILCDSGSITKEELAIAGLEEEQVACHTTPPPAHKRKEDIAREMGISRTTLWRRSKKKRDETQ